MTSSCVVDYQIFSGVLWICSAVFFVLLKCHRNKDLESVNRRQRVSFRVEIVLSLSEQFETGEFGVPCPQNSSISLGKALSFCMC